MSHHPHSHKKRSAAQIAASAKWSAAGRKAAAKKKRTAKQIAAAKNSLVKARAVSRMHHHHHATGHAHTHAHGHAVVHKKARAPDMQSVQSVHSFPVCAPVAFAEHIYWQTGFVVTDEHILSVHRQVGDVSIAELIEFCAANGFAGYHLDSFSRGDEAQYVPGLIYGVSLPIGYHAALATSHGLISWGLSLPLIGVPAEAWELSWSAYNVTPSKGLLVA